MATIITRKKAITKNKARDIDAPPKSEAALNVQDATATGTINNPREKQDRIPR